MKLVLLLIAASILTFAVVAQADTFESKCPDIAPCARVVGELLNQKYVFDNDVKGQFHATQNLELTKENAELLFTNMLAAEGYSRVPLGQPGLYQIVRQRDARDGPLPLVEATKAQAPDLPQNWDLMTMRYRATNPEMVEHIARTSRSFMPAASRIIPVEMGGTLLVTDTSMNLKKLYAIIRDLDLPLTAKDKARLEREHQEWLKRQTKTKE
jgi:type II secretory pathway component GspD/PulD (secretin)